MNKNSVVTNHAVQQVEYLGKKKIVWGDIKLERRGAAAKRTRRRRREKEPPEGIATWGVKKSNFQKGRKTQMQKVEWACHDDIVIRARGRRLRVSEEKKK